MSDLEMRLSEIIQDCGGTESNLIAILLQAQSEYQYLSRDILKAVAKLLEISEAKVYSVATFYQNFTLEARGIYVVRVCNGTACHVRKSDPIYQTLRRYLDLQDSQKTSSDGMFTLETVACLGACSLAPAMTVNDKVYAKMTPESAVELLDQLRAEVHDND